VLDPRIVPAEKVTATVLAYQPDLLRLEVRAPAAGWLLVTDRWAWGWRATVNGRDAKVWIGNLLFRAVAVQPGLNRVEFVYRPFGHPWLWIASWSTLALLLMASVAAGVWRPRPASSATNVETRARGS
jgi:uncharacterized membrane protein YfhO